MMDEPSGQNAEPSFEKELANLENAVNLLERGDLGLEAAIREYERGFQSIKRCQEILERAQKKVEVLVGRDGTNPSVFPPPGAPEGAAPSPPGPPEGAAVSWRPLELSSAAPVQHAPADGPPE